MSIPSDPACFDLETYLIAPGAVFPKAVLGAFSHGARREVLAREAMLDWVEARLLDGTVLVNQSIGFDMGVVGRHRPHLLPAIFEAYSDNRIGCVEMLAQLFDIALYGNNNRTKSIRYLDAYSRRASVDTVIRRAHTKSCKKPDGCDCPWATDVGRGYSLQNLASRWLGVELLKDSTRTTYADWDNVPVERLPARQREYVLADLCALDVWHAVWREAARQGIPLDNVWAQSRRDFALRLTEARGRYTDPVQVARLTAEAETALADGFAALCAAGILQREPGNLVFTRVPDGWRKPARAKRWWAEHLGAHDDGRRHLNPKHTPEAALDFVGLYRTPLQAIDSLPAETVAQFEWAGLWERRWRREHPLDANGERVREQTDEWKMKASPLQAVALAVQNKLPRGLDGEPVKMPTTDGGAFSVGDDAVQFAEELLPGDPDVLILRQACDYKRAGSIRAAMQRLARGAIEPLHPRCNGLAETGRTTSGGGMAKINDQNHRREYGFREANIPRRGHAFVSSDYSQIELCGGAQLQLWMFGKSRMAEQINAGVDLHCEMAADILNIEYAEALARKKAGDRGLKSARDLAKAYNFGKPGALAELSFIEWARAQYGVVIPYSEWAVVPTPGYVEIPLKHLPGSMWLQRIPEHLADAARDPNNWSTDGLGTVRPIPFHVPSDPAGQDRVGRRWLQSKSPGGRIFCKERTQGHLESIYYTKSPEVLDYLARVKEAVEENAGRITQSISGRQRGRCSYPQAANSYFQGLVADGATQALYEVWRECLTVPSSPLYGCAPVWFVHDEIGLEAPLDRLHEAAYRCSEVMVEVMQRYIPDVRVEAEPAAMRRWTKAADEPRLHNGRLVCEEDWRLATGYYAGKDYLAQEHADVVDFFKRYGLRRQM